jgi:hypothetical protein
VTADHPVPQPSRIDRLLGAYPLLLAYVLLLILYAWQSTKHVTPWLFTDELQWADLSRGVAHHGFPEIRLERQPFSSLYAYLIAPAWWASTTSAGYAAAKYINVAVMTASLFPAYALARLFVPRTAAIACGIATACVPALYFSSLLIPEPAAYFWSTLVLWLVARALVVRSWRAVAVAVVATVISPAVRSELTVLIFAAVVAAAIVAATGRRGRATIGGWSWRERGGAVLLLLGGAIALGAFANHHSYSWEIGTHFHDRMFTYGLWAVGALTIGAGTLPVVLALAWLLGNRFRTLEDRVLGGVFVGAVVAFGMYTAVKASYISTNFAIRVEERNLMYVAPVLFAVVARWAFAGRLRLIPLALSGAAVGYLLDTTPYHNNEHFYSDAPGLSVLQWLNQKIYFTTDDARRLLFVILAWSIVVALVRGYAARRGFLRALAIPGGMLLAVGVIGWNLWGEIAAANASNSFSRTFVSIPLPRDWIDRQTGGAHTMFIGQSLQTSNEFWSIEFWNQSLQYVWSVDATAPTPGPSTTPNYLGTDGAVDPQIPVDWIVASPGVNPVGDLRETAGGLRLYHVSHPIRIADAEGNVSTDANWMSTSAWYYRFTSAGKEPGYATVSLSRAAACGSFKPSHMTIRLSSLRITPEPQAQPVAKKLLAVRHVTVRSNPCTSNLVVKIPARTPYRIDVTADGTFQPSEFDQRQLSAQITFGFEPRKKR